ncbi:MAG: type I restriction endonuclease subunit R, partial [Lentisphaeria bacterium]
MITKSKIAETNHFIVLEEYSKQVNQNEQYQSESDLEKELIFDLVNQGYEFLPNLTSPENLLENVKAQLQNLNSVNFSDSEWVRFCEQYLDKPSDNHIDKTRKIHDDYIYDFTFDDGSI